MGSGGGSPLLIVTPPGVPAPAPVALSTMVMGARPPAPFPFTTCWCVACPLLGM